MKGFYLLSTTPAARLLVRGEDAAAFLLSQFSNELRPYTEQRGAYGFWLDAKGKVLQDGWVFNKTSESFEVYSDYCAESDLRAKLEKYIIADAVEVETLSQGLTLHVMGAGATRALKDCLGSIPEEGSFLEIGTCLVHADRSSETMGYLCRFSDAESPEVKALIEQLEGLGGSFVSEDWMHARRIEAGSSIVPNELCENDLPGEAGEVGSAVCTTKGCFLGQESVLRLHNLGQARRGLYAVKGTGTTPTAPCPVTTNDEAKSAGTVRSVYQTEDGWIGVAMLKLRYLETEMSCEGSPLVVSKAMGKQTNL